LPHAPLLLSHPRRRAGRGQGPPRGRPLAPEVLLGPAFPERRHRDHLRPRPRVSYRRFGLLVLLWWQPVRLQAQGPVVVEWGLHATATVVDSTRVGLFAGPRLGLRTLGG